jgi:hypothetical protein
MIWSLAMQLPPIFLIMKQNFYSRLFANSEAATVQRFAGKMPISVSQPNGGALDRHDGRTCLATYAVLISTLR